MALSLSRYGLNISVAAILLAGCGASEPPVANGAAPDAPVSGSRAIRAQSPISLDVRRQKLIYVSWNFHCGGPPLCGNVSVYTWSGKFLTFWDAGQNDRTYGECTDEAGNVFVASVLGAVEFKHGGTSPIKTIGDPSGFPTVCSVDVTTGNLAVISYSYGSYATSVLIYPDASGSPEAYNDNGLYFSYAGYDDAGNLFVDGTKTDGSFGFAELPRGGSAFRTIKLNQVIEAPGSVQWDGKHITVGDFSADVIYRFEISGTRGKKVGSTALGGYTGFAQTWILNHAVIGVANFCSGIACDTAASIYDYPAGGIPLRIVPGNVYFPGGAMGITVSQ
jgi:hypothetical protein